jgi:hypothetical protein
MTAVNFPTPTLVTDSQLWVVKFVSIRDQRKKEATNTRTNKILAVIHDDLINMETTIAFPHVARIYADYFPVQKQAYQLCFQNNMIQKILFFLGRMERMLGHNYRI